MSEEIHPTNVTALRYLGIGHDDIEHVMTDDQGRLIVDQLPALDERTILILQAGNINSGSFDDFATLCRRAREAGAWVHIDGAFGLWARASRKRQYLADSVELADSWSVDGHKWLNLPQDSAIFACRNPRAVQ